MTEPTAPEEEDTNGVAVDASYGTTATWQTGPVDTTGVSGGIKSVETMPVFAQHKADTLQAAIDDLSGDAPAGSGNVSVDPDITEEETEALVADLTTAQAEAQALADGPELDEDGNVVEPEDDAPVAKTTEAKTEPKKAAPTKATHSTTKPTGV